MYPLVSVSGVLWKHYPESRSERYTSSGKEKQQSLRQIIIGFPANSHILSFSSLPSYSSILRLPCSTPRPDEAFGTLCTSPNYVFSLTMTEPSRWVVIDDRDSLNRIRYSEGWQSIAGDDHNNLGNFGETYRNSLHATDNDGAEMSFSFRGERLSRNNSKNIHKYAS